MSRLPTICPFAIAVMAMMISCSLPTTNDQEPELSLATFHISSISPDEAKSGVERTVTVKGSFGQAIRLEYFVETFLENKVSASAKRASTSRYKEPDVFSKDSKAAKQARDLKISIVGEPAVLNVVANRLDKNGEPETTSTPMRVRVLPSSQGTLPVNSEEE